MKPSKKKKSKDELELGAEPDTELDDTRPIPFEALAELTSSDVIAQVKMGMSSIEPLELDEESDESAF